MKKSLLLIVAMVASLSAWADVTINETNFPDGNFRNYLLSRPYGSDGVLTDGEIAAIIIIDVSSKSIADLTGIEHFTALQALYCSINQLTELDVSHNTALIFLACNNNQLTGLDVSHNTALDVLYCFNNPLTELDVSHNTALRQLNCSNNQLTELKVNQNMALEALDCSDNSLTELEVSQNTALEALYCNNNQLTELEVSQNTALKRLGCSNNPLTGLDVSYNTALTQLYCSNIQLAELDVSHNTALGGLDCSNNSLTELDVSQNTAMDVFECYNNQLTELDVSQNTALVYFDCSGNQINGGNMEALVASLPTVDIDYWGENGSFIVIDLDSETEQNVITTTQVATARGKNWTVYGLIDDDWQEYDGSEPTYYAITLAEALASGNNGDNVMLSDALAVVQKTEDGALAYVTDGNNHWARLEGGEVADLVVGSGITGITGQLTNMGTAPTIVLAGAPTEADAPDYQIMPLDLKHDIAEPPAACQVVSVSGFYDGLKVRAFRNEPQGQGLLINADHSTVALQVGHLYEIVGAIELLEPWDNDASGAPRRVKATDDDFLDNIYLMLIGGEEKNVTSITDLAADYDKDIEAIYTLDGLRVESVSNGVYIIRFKDGSVKKALF